MMPSLASASRRFETTMQFMIVNKTIVDGDLVESSKAPVALWFEGAVLPMPARDLAIKPEGQRGFKWWNMYTDLDLVLDSIIKDQAGLIYRVMSKSDWGDANFISYELLEGVGLNNQ